MDIFSARKFASEEGWLSQTPETFQNAILEKSILKRFETGATVYAIGDAQGGPYCLLRGGFRVTVSPGDDGPYLAHLYKPGIWIGEGPLISGRPRVIGLTAAGETDTLYVPLHALHEILRRDPGAWRHVALLMFMNATLAVNVISDLLIRDHVQRLITILMRLGGCSDPASPPSSGIEITVSQEELAAMCNVARTTVNSTLRQLQKAGAIEITYRRIVIVAPNKLRTMLVEEEV